MTADTETGQAFPVMAACYWKEMWKKLNMMRELWQLCDIEIFSSDEHMFMAHSPVLAASSEIFHAFLVNKDRSVITEKGDHQLYLSEVPSDILQITLDFIYGNMPATLEAFEKLEKGAKMLGIKGAMSFIGHRGSATKPGARCPMAHWKKRKVELDSSLPGVPTPTCSSVTDHFSIDHVLFSIPQYGSSDTAPTAPHISHTTPTASQDRQDISSIAKEALDVMNDICVEANDDEKDDEPKCPFAKSLGIQTRGMENPHTGKSSYICLCMSYC